MHACLCIVCGILALGLQIIGPNPTGTGLQLRVGLGAMAVFAILVGLSIACAAAQVYFEASRAQLSLGWCLIVLTLSALIKLL